MIELVLQPALAELAIALSVFSLITYLWLGLTVLLMGDRRSLVTWVGGIGLLLAALFFLCHGALVGAGVPSSPNAIDIWWHLAWVPGFAAPIFWAAIGLHYAGLVGTLRRLRLPVLIGVAALGGISALLALLSWPAIGRYGDFIRLLGASLSFESSRRLPGTLTQTLPALGVSFVIYVAVCAVLPWMSLALTRNATGQTVPQRANADGLLIWDAADAWTRARPALLGASLCMIGAGLVVAVIGIFSALAEGNALRSTVPPGLRIDVPASPPGHVSLALVAADLAVQIALAALGILVGWAVVRQGVLIERRLPQRGFLSRWRGTAFVGGILAAVVAAMTAFDSGALPELLVLVTLVTATYALFTWQSYGEHDRLLDQLRPFINSLTVGHTGWLATDTREVERNVDALFNSLCRDVLGATWGRIFVTAGRLHHNFSYGRPAGETTGTQEWTLPVMDERGVVATLVLGPRTDGAVYTSADLEIARACGQRILDAIGEFAAAQAIASLARKRGLESELSAALPRRVLHDDVLPRLHLAMLRLEALRGKVAQLVPEAAGRGTAPHSPSVTEDVGEDLGVVVRELGKAHHDLAMLMRATPAANPRRLEHGLTSVLRASLDGEFRGTFDTLQWEVPPDAASAADKLPPVVADLLLGAALEAVRNAGRHARGTNLHRKLELRITMTADAQAVSVLVADDGVGLQSEMRREIHQAPDSSNPGASQSSGHIPAITPGTRTGLLTHGALIALVGGTLTVRSQPEVGTTVTVRVPRSEDNRSGDLT